MGKFTTTDAIIAKAIRDYGLADTGWVPNAREWAGEAIEFIGTNKSKVLTVKSYDIDNDEVKLPCDLDCVVGVTMNGCWVYWQANTGMQMYSTTGEYRPYILNGKLKFNAEKVKFDLVYYAFATDCDGLILVPDVIEARDAVAKYILMMCLSSGMKHPVYSLRDAYDLWNKARDRATNRLMYPAPYEVPYSYGEFANAMP
jgi:hypothetical protein